MDGESVRLGDAAHLFHEAGLTDARIAAHIDDLSIAPTKASVKDSLELLTTGTGPAQMRGRSFYLRNPDNRIL